MSSILFLSQSLPFPPDTGGTQRAYHVLRELQEEFDVVLISFSRRGHQPDRRARESAERELAARLSEVLPSVPFPSEWSLLRRTWDHARSVLTGKAYSYFQYGVAQFGRRIEQAMATRVPDLVHFDSIDFFHWFDRFRGVPITCTHHDIESHLLAQRAATAKSLAVATYIRHQATLLRRTEAEYCPRFDLNLTMSRADSSRLLEIAPEARVAEAPNAVDLNRFPLPECAAEKPGSVIFVGPTFLFANKDAVAFLLGDIWPRVLASVPDANLTLVGKNSPGEKDEFAKVSGVRPLGRVEEIQPHVGGASCSVIPIRVGGGTRIKILESWALGRAVVTTSIGAEGLDVRDGENALVRDDSQQFADAVVRILTDRALRERLGHAGRRTVEARYTWSKVGDEIRSLYRRIIEGSKSPGRGQQ